MLPVGRVGGVGAERIEGWLEVVSRGGADGVEGREGEEQEPCCKPVKAPAQNTPIFWFIHPNLTYTERTSFFWEQRSFTTG